ncbi:hypothetical protein [Methyloterricola oryzae]|uniref:hypothetical protein n=1 Tax=Methyloterricola oryzae TaxID=1495050 RepID=UPI0011AF5AFF
MVHADGADYIATCRDRFDAIFLDGFDGERLPSRLCSQNFYKRCAVALKKSGILVANLLEGDWSIGTCVKLSVVKENVNNRREKP